METANDQAGGTETDRLLPASNVSETVQSSPSNPPSENSLGGTASMNGPAVLAQPLASGPSTASGGERQLARDAGGSSRTTIDVVRGAFANAQDALASGYRAASSSTDDFVHESPWKAVAFAVLGGIIVGMLAAR